MHPSPAPRPHPGPRLMLASTSPYRRELLARLRYPFDVAAPDVDETPQPDEPPADLALRLAALKAKAVTATLAPDDDVLVIGSDQVADLNGTPLGKPGTHERAVAQWRAMRGQRVAFHTAVCVWRPRTQHLAVALDTVTVQMRMLDDADIETYLRLEQPYDCAGSAKCETLGIALLDAIESRDPTSLVGLPLILTNRLLRDAGLDILAQLRHD
ncbi:MAG: Maf family nucleotide pyrophosphatase [Aquabacterium sp.]